MLIVATESFDMDIVYGPTLCEAVWEAASTLISGTKVLTVRRVNTKNEKPAKMHPKAF